LKEIMAHWPTQESWEGRLEIALSTQGGLVLLASFVVGGGIVIRGAIAKAKDEQITRRDLAQRKKHERSAERRH
jgi:hypothetical protein